MPTENVLDNSRFINGITFVLMASMLLLSMMAGAAQGYSNKKTSVVSGNELAEGVVMKDVKASNGVMYNVVLPLN